jgi:pilus assembly protein CpaE
MMAREDMANQNAYVKIKVGSAQILRQLETAVASIEGLEVQNGGDGRRTDLLIFEVGNNLQKEFEIVRTLLSSSAVTEVFVTARKTDPALLLQTMKAGIREFLSQPLNETEVREALEGFRKRMQASGAKKPLKFGQIINVIGSKGGVGTTTVAVNLAAGLAEGRGAGSVALVDMNRVFGEVPLFLGLKAGYHWGEIVKNIDRLDATFLISAMSKHNSGLCILPSPSSLENGSATTPEIMQRLLTLMKRTFDLVIVDGGQSFDTSSLKVIEMSDVVVVVSLLNLPCLSNTKNLLNMFYDSNIAQKDRVRLLINRNLETSSELSVKDAAEITHTPVFWSIPNDYRTTMSAINQGKTLQTVSPKAPITRGVQGLAAALLGVEVKQEVTEERKTWNLFRRLQKAEA